MLKGLALRNRSNDFKHMEIIALRDDVRAAVSADTRVVSVDPV